MAKTNLFHVQETVLRANGFIKEVLNDKKYPDDKINTLRFEYYTRQIKDDLNIEISYFYLTDDGKQFRLESSTVDLWVNGENCQIPIKRLSDLLNLILILKGDE